MLLQLKVMLRDIQPAIWRRALLDDSRPSPCDPTASGLGRRSPSSLRKLATMVGEAVDAAGRSSGAAEPNTCPQRQSRRPDPEKLSRVQERVRQRTCPQFAMGSMNLDVGSIGQAEQPFAGATCMAASSVCRWRISGASASAHIPAASNYGNEVGVNRTRPKTLVHTSKHLY